MLRYRSIFTFAVLAVLLACCQTAGAKRRSPAPPFKAAHAGPLKVGTAPTDVAVEEFGRGFYSGDGFPDLIVLSSGAGSFFQYENRRGPLAKIATGPAGVAPQGFLLLRSYLFIADTGSDQLRILFNPADRSDLWRYRPHLALPVGDAPEAVASGGYDADLVVANKASDDVTVVDVEDVPSFYGSAGFSVAATVPVGDAPTDIQPGKSAIYVANSGSGTLTLLKHFAEGRFLLTRTIPVGGAPTATATDDFIRDDFGDDELAVADSASDSVKIFDSANDTFDYRMVGSYPVGDDPVEIVSANIDYRDGPDLVVVNRGSNDVSVLLNDGDGTMSPGGRAPVGKRPVAIAPIALDRYFEPDFVVANSGSNEVTLLLRNESGRCQGRAAHRSVGSPQADRLRGAFGPNQLSGRGGRDRVTGEFAPDCLNGGSGADELDGYSGDDLFSGGPGDDELIGRNGRDRLFGGPGDDELHGGLGIFGAPAGAWRDLLVGGAGNDRIDGGRGRDTMLGGPGRDTILAREGDSDVVDCGRGPDLVKADRRDTVRGCERRR
jgi:Ca2+-binding RTX toxin-like protein